MRRLALYVLPFVLLAACSSNRSPSRPELSGPAAGRPGDPLTFAAVSTDPDGHEVAYKFAWGDTSSIEWSPYYAGGQPVLRVRAVVEVDPDFVILAADVPPDGDAHRSFRCDRLR